MPPETHAQKEHRASTIFILWDSHAIILCSSTEGISQLEGAYWLEGSYSAIHKGPFFKKKKKNGAQLLKTDMSGDSTKSDEAAQCILNYKPSSVLLSDSVC